MKIKLSQLQCQTTECNTTNSVDPPTHSSLLTCKGVIDTISAEYKMTW